MFTGVNVSGSSPPLDLPPEDLESAVLSADDDEDSADADNVGAAAELFDPVEPADANAIKYAQDQRNVFIAGLR